MIDNDDYAVPEDVKENTQCGECGKLINDFWDGCGYFYDILEGHKPKFSNVVGEYTNTWEDRYEAICRKCWKERGCNTCER